MKMDRVEEAKKVMQEAVPLGYDDRCALLWKDIVGYETGG